MATSPTASTTSSTFDDEAKELWPEWKFSFGKHLPVFLIPDLQDDENYEEWRFMAHTKLRACNLEGFIEGTETPPQGDDSRIARLNQKVFAERRQYAFRIIYDSIHPILQQLKSSGHWILDANDRDPKVLWDAVHRWDVDRPLTYKCRLMEELVDICHCQHNSDILAYRDRAFWLRTRLKRMGTPIADQLYMGFLVKGLRTYDSIWADYLYKQIESGSLNPSQLEVDIGSQYPFYKQLRERREGDLKNKLVELESQIRGQPRNKRRRKAKDHHSGPSGVAKRCSNRH
ncbi:hypothetical protein GE21DRAFT_7141 [Neurospora crassa]|uniref:Uncharacterized protein n=2 Tax=Neurospora crassa TaxID=5141 RepID=Q1K663_NEUCR|nr:hypothetical protein NCU04573 [Neurospora crassa OR74A]EAA29436.1 hypothetical protein NCU04573 [Neurospora crassa OR74A]KHE78466.1 hypothetical protein GE21DRAFT_7141 [Neurospora crassa]CAD70768.1 hypothetical protein [Neurospora crassa]|eukprot:XP_958672.1 hypothetical protein NCU04573 [Neurospora crassa OR74A]